MIRMHLSGLEVRKEGIKIIQKGRGERNESPETGRINVKS